MSQPERTSRAYDAILTFLRALVRLFFREIEVTGLEHVPLDRGGVIVSWHPNGLIDPGLILTQFPRQVVFGARHGLFKWPVLGALLKSVGTVPIFRAIDATTSDPEKRKEANRRTLSALANAVASGPFAALFPEGVSHDEPHPVELKTGAARLYFQARALKKPGEPPPVLVPVGLHYDQKSLFRSRALVAFHPPLDLPDDIDSAPSDHEPEDRLKERAKRLTAEIERALDEVVHATDDWAIHHLLHRGRKLLRAERAARAGADPGKPGIQEKALGFARIRNAYCARLETHPEEVAKLRARVNAYDADMRALGLEDHELDRDPRLFSSRLAFSLALQLITVFLLAPPLIVFGYFVNGLPALVLIGLSRVAARRKKDIATIKLLVGALLFPLTWIGAGAAAFFAHQALETHYPWLPNSPVAAALLVVLVAGLGGALALRYLEVAAETLRALRVRFTRARRRASIERLRKERSDIHDALMKMAAGLDLPGVVHADGTIGRE